jgi:hypothetical protein
MLHPNSDRTSNRANERTDRGNHRFTFSACSIDPQLAPSERDHAAKPFRSDAIVRSLEADFAVDDAKQAARGSRDDGLMLCVGAIVSVLSIAALISSRAPLCQTMRSIAIESTQAMMQN